MRIPITAAKLRWLLPLVAASVALSISVSTVAAADPIIHFDRPEMLFNDAHNRPPPLSGGPRMLQAGTYQWEHDIDPVEKRLDGRLTFQFAPVTGSWVGKPGPVILFWSLGGCVDTDPKFEGCVPIFDAPVQAEVRLPVCIPAGACAVGFSLTQSVARQLDAAVRRPDGEIHIRFSYTAIRTFVGGAFQVMPPQSWVGGDSKDLPFAGYTYGINFDHAPFGPQHRINPELYEFNYLSAMRRALRSFDPANPAPGFYPRVAVWIGESPGHFPTMVPDPRVTPCHEMTFCGPPLPATSMNNDRPMTTRAGIGLVILAVVLGGAQWLLTARRRDCPLPDA